jgi:hypothetical protein
VPFAGIVMILLLRKRTKTPTTRRIRAARADQVDKLKFSSAARKLQCMREYDLVLRRRRCQNTVVCVLKSGSADVWARSVPNLNNLR